MLTRNELKAARPYNSMMDMQSVLVTDGEGNQTLLYRCTIGVFGEFWEIQQYTSQPLESEEAAETEAILKAIAAIGKQQA